MNHRIYQGKEELITRIFSTLNYVFNRYSIR